MYAEFIALQKNTLKELILDEKQVNEMLRRMRESSNIFMHELITDLGNKKIDSTFENLIDLSCFKYKGAQFIKISESEAMFVELDPVYVSGEIRPIPKSGDTQLILVTNDQLTEIKRELERLKIR